MGKVRLARSVQRALLVACVVALCLVAWVPTSGAVPPEPTESRVTPVILHACPAGPNLVTAWGYNNSSAGTVTITFPDNDDDPRATFGDGDSDDNFFVPAPENRGQGTTFLAGAHGSITTTEPAPTTWVLGTNYTTSSGPLNCADLAAAKTQAVDTVTAGSQQQYLVAVANNGPTAAQNVTITDTLTTTAVSGVTATPSTGSCTVAVPTITCGSIPSLASGSSVTIAISLTATTPGTLGDSVTAASDTYDPNLSNNTASVSATVAAPGGSTGGGVLNEGQQLTVNGTQTTGTVKVQTGTVPLTLAIQPQSACPPGATCKSDLLDIEPHATPSGQTLTAVFDTGKPSPFVLIPFVKFYVYKDGVDRRLPACRPYLRPKPLPDGSACEYFRWMNLKGHAIVYVALGAQDPRVHR